MLLKELVADGMLFRLGRETPHHVPDDIPESVNTMSGQAKRCGQKVGDDVGEKSRRSVDVDRWRLWLHYVVLEVTCIPDEAQEVGKLQRKQLGIRI